MRFPRSPDSSGEVAAGAVVSPGRSPWCSPPPCGVQVTCHRAGGCGNSRSRSSRKGVAIAEAGLRRWMDQAEVDERAKVGLTSDERRELIGVRRRARQLEMENEILERAAAMLVARFAAQLASISVTPAAFSSSVRSGSQRTRFRRASTNTRSASAVTGPQRFTGQRVDEPVGVRDVRRSRWGRLGHVILRRSRSLASSVRRTSSCRRRVRRRPDLLAVAISGAPDSRHYPPTTVSCPTVAHGGIPAVGRRLCDGGGGGRCVRGSSGDRGRCPTHSSAPAHCSATGMRQTNSLIRLGEPACRRVREFDGGQPSLSSIHQRWVLPDEAFRTASATRILWRLASDVWTSPKVTTDVRWWEEGHAGRVSV